MKGFTIQDMISFGTYLLSEERNKKASEAHEKYWGLTNKGISPDLSLAYEIDEANLLDFEDWQEWKKRNDN